MHLVPRWILSSVDPSLAHLMNPLVKARALLQGKVPPGILEGTITRYLLPIGNKPSNIISVDMVSLVIGDSVHSHRRVVMQRRER